MAFDLAKADGARAERVMSILNNSFVVAILSAVGFIVAYRFYGRFISRRVLGFDPNRKTPAHTYRDGMDYVPTHPAVLFGHHFASIAGLGPIVGPAIAVFWGWVPALLWVVFGSIFIGAVHDLSTLYASLRHEGRSIGDLTNDIIGPRARMLFLFIIFFLLALAMGVFVLLMAQLFTDLSPQAVVPTFALIAIALIIGLLGYRWNWRLGPLTLLGLGLMLATLAVGMKRPVSLYPAFVSDEARTAIRAAGETGVDIHRAGTVEQHFAQRGQDRPQFKALAAEVAAAGQKSKDTWTYVLLIYALAASILPVWLLLQPRDYINSYQLYLGLAVILLGLAVWSPRITAPMFPRAEMMTGHQPILPFLFITIACGAVSGFHNLVSSGTTARQIRSERDATVIGYGAMLTEGFLAVLVILACCAGLGERYHAVYGSGFTGTMALGAFLEGASNVIARPFLWLSRVSSVDQATVVAFCKSFIAVVVVSFAMTTLDSATRLLRYNIEAIGKVTHLGVLRNRYVAGVIAVVAIGCFALLKINGQPAGKTLWQLFGTTNQLLAAIGLLVVSVMLFALRKPIVYTLIPLAVMLVSVSWAMAYKLREFYNGWREHGDSGNAALFAVGAVLAVLTVWLVIESVVVFVTKRQRLRTATLPAAAAPQTPS